MNLSIGLKNFKSVIACVWFNIATASDRLSFFLSFFQSSGKNYSLTLPREKFVSQVVTWPAATRVFLPVTKGQWRESLGTRLLIGTHNGIT